MERFQQNSADIITAVYIEIIQFSIKAISNLNEANLIFWSYVGCIRIVNTRIINMSLLDYN